MHIILSLKQRYFHHGNTASRTREVTTSLERRGIHNTRNIPDLPTYRCSCRINSPNAAHYRKKHLVCDTFFLLSTTPFSPHPYFPLHDRSAFHCASDSDIAVTTSRRSLDCDGNDNNIRLPPFVRRRGIRSAVFPAASSPHFRRWVSYLPPSALRLINQWPLPPSSTTTTTMVCCLY